MMSAIPTTDGDGIVRSWELEVKFAAGGYSAKYTCTLEDGELPDKTPDEFTRQELWDLCDMELWNRMFDSMYDSVMNAPVPVRHRKETFDVKRMKDR